MQFYPDEKPHISPSALSMWHSSKSAFIKSYFEGEKGVESLAMKTGKELHALIEGGFLEPCHVFSEKEKKIETLVDGTVKGLGIPDSHTVDQTEVAEFVDYKTGKEFNWTKKKLSTDLKMKMTAWLVLTENPNVEKVIGHIDWIETKYDEEKKEYIPTGNHETISIEYTTKELLKFVAVIKKTIEDVNAEYESWGESTEQFIDKYTTDKYEQLVEIIEETKEELAEVGERIKQQMELGCVAKHKSPGGGLYYFMEKRQYEYPKNLEVKVGNLTYKLSDAEDKESDFTAAIKAVKNDFAKSNDPQSTSRSLAFRVKKTD